jgi:hypothetical protein
MIIEMVKNKISLFFHATYPAKGNTISLGSGANSVSKNERAKTPK